MSQNYTLRCSTCDKTLDEYFRNGDRDLAALVAHAPLMQRLSLVEAEAWNKLQAEGAWVEVETTVRLNGGGRVPLDWFEHHGHHALEVVPW